MRFRPTTFAALACCLLSGLLPAQQETAAFPENEALSAAIAVETLERDLQRAAELYREVAESADGSVAPTVRRHAWLRLGMLLERLGGQDEARATALQKAAVGDDAIAQAARELLERPAPDLERLRALERAAEEMTADLGPILSNIEQLVTIGEPAIPAITRFLDGYADSNISRSDTIHSLPWRIGGPRAYGYVERRLQDGDERDRREIAGGLLGSKQNTAADMVSIARQLLDDANPEVVRCAILSELFSIEELAPLLEDDRLDVVENATLGLRNARRTDDRDWIPIISYLRKPLTAADPRFLRAVDALAQRVVGLTHEGRMLMFDWIERRRSDVNCALAPVSEQHVDVELNRLVEVCRSVGEQSSQPNPLATTVERHLSASHHLFARRHLDALLALIELGYGAVIPQAVVQTESEQVDREAVQACVDTLQRVPTKVALTSLAGALGTAPVPEELWDVIVDAGAVERLDDGTLRFPRFTRENRDNVLMAAAWTGHPDFAVAFGASDFKHQYEAKHAASAARAYQTRRGDRASLDVVETVYGWSWDLSLDDLFETLIDQGPDMTLAALQRDSIRRNASLAPLVRTSDEPSDAPNDYPFGSVADYHRFWESAIAGVLGEHGQLGALFQSDGFSYSTIDPVVLEKLVEHFESRPLDTDLRFDEAKLFIYGLGGGQGPAPLLQRIEDRFLAAMRSAPPGSSLRQELLAYWPASRPVPDALAEAILAHLSESGSLIQFCLRHGVRIEPETLRRELFEPGIGEYDYDDLIEAIGPQPEVDNAEIAQVLSDLGLSLLDRGGMAARNAMPAICRKLAVFLDPAGVPVLLRALRFDNEPTRAAARAALEAIRFHAEQKAHWDRLLAGEPELGSSKVASRLVGQAAPDQPRPQRLLAIRSLGALGEPAALTFLVDWSADADPEIASAASAAAERILARDR